MYRYKSPLIPLIFTTMLAALMAGTMPVGAAGTLPMAGCGSWQQVKSPNVGPGGLALGLTRLQRRLSGRRGNSSNVPASPSAR